MNYFIQGDAANADKIKAAFEKLGYEKVNVIHIGDYANERLFFFTENGKVRSTLKDCGIVNIIKTHPDYKELPLEPLFKVGDWVVTDYGKVSQVVSVDNAGDGYTLDDGVYFSGSWCDMYHLWTIADAKDGDILSAKIDGDDYILIFKQIKDGWIETYGHYYITIDKFCAPTQMFCRNYQGRLYPATQEQYRTLFKKMRDDGYEWDFDKNELKKIPVKPKFKVGDWVVSPNGSQYLIAYIDKEDNRYLFEINEYTGEPMHYEDVQVVDGQYHLWTIADAKDGDVLYFNDNTIVVFKDLYNSTTFHSYCHIEDDLFEISEDEMPDWWESKGFTPATKEQRDLLFAKMKEVGYQWDVDKKELRKIRPHYDISNFHAGMPVLVRADNNCRWDYSVFSRITGNKDWQFAVCNGVSVAQCIPFEGNEALLGTTDMPSEEYINW